MRAVHGVEIGKVSRPHLPRPPRRQAQDRVEGADPQPRRPLADLHPGRGPRLHGDRREPRRRPPPDHQAQHRRRGDRRLRRPRAGQHRPAGRAAGDGGQGGAVQALRRHRRLPHLPRHPGHRGDRRARSRRSRPVFAGINLEDISAPRCFEIEARLREELDIPVFHDDQHGTAIVALAALRNALRVVGKDLQRRARGHERRGRRRHRDPQAAAQGRGAPTWSSPTSTASSTPSARTSPPASTRPWRWIADAHQPSGLSRARSRRPSPAPTSSSASPPRTSSPATTSPR